jgi:hypothetical protein
MARAARRVGAAASSERRAGHACGREVRRGCTGPIWQRRGRMRWHGRMDRAPSWERWEARRERREAQRRREACNAGSPAAPSGMRRPRVRGGVRRAGRSTAQAAAASAETHVEAALGREPRGGAEVALRCRRLEEAAWQEEAPCQRRCHAVPSRRRGLGCTDAAAHAAAAAASPRSSLSLSRGSRCRDTGPLGKSPAARPAVPLLQPCTIRGIHCARGPRHGLESNGGTGEAAASRTSCACLARAATAAGDVGNSD